jgi:hypothetical protein
MNAFNLYEAYAAVYDEDLREDILTVEEDFSFIDDLSDNELVQVMESILLDGQYTLDECVEVFDYAILSEETEMERMNRLQNKATREKKAAAATSKREKSAERERVGRKHAMKRVQVAAGRAAQNIARGASEAGRKVGEGAKKVGGKLAAAKEKISGFLGRVGRAARAGVSAAKKEFSNKETATTGKEVKDAAKKTISGVDRRKAAEAKQKTYAAGGRGTVVMQGQPAGTFKSKKSRSEAQKREARLTASESYETLASYILEDLINEGYAETFEEAFTVLESFSDYEVGEIAENYLTEETETVDLYDVVLEHLLDEGYADTEEAATVIMANMSEEWREEILDEAAVRNRGLVDGRNKLANDAIDAAGRTVPTHPKGLRMIPTRQSFRRLPDGNPKTKHANKAKKDAYYQDQRYGKGSSGVF